MKNASMLCFMSNSIVVFSRKEMVTPILHSSFYILHLKELSVKKLHTIHILRSFHSRIFTAESIHKSVDIAL